MATEIEVKKYNYPVYATQGGGLARQVDRDIYVFVEAPPPGMGLCVGDYVPREWDIAPANHLARIETEMGTDEFYWT